MTTRPDVQHHREVSELAQPLDDTGDLDPLLDRIGDATVVLVGEASHGTHEYYHWRAQLTKRLVAEHGFTVVAVEGDWPDCHRIDRHVRGLDGDDGARDVLRGFERWPTWMWANQDVAEFATWLREHNAGRDGNDQVGFYGLDVYSLWDSLREILRHLEDHESEAASAARRAWGCFEPYHEDPQQYGWATRVVPTSCEDEVVDLLTRAVREADLHEDGHPEARFQVEQNAAVVAGAERYYRAMVRGGPASWNIRDHHMTDTLERILDHRGPGARAVVWEHNTHVGDARATDMAAAGMVNVGQLVRERWGRDETVVVGAGGHHGTVLAAQAWGDAVEEMRVPAAMEGSLEDLLHQHAPPRCQFVFPDRPVGWLDERRGHRAIGVVYRPALERPGQYVPTVLGERYDAFWYFDATSALTPVGPGAPAPDEEQETYPYGV